MNEKVSLTSLPISINRYNFNASIQVTPIHVGHLECPF